MTATADAPADVQESSAEPPAADLSHIDQALADPGPTPQRPVAAPAVDPRRLKRLLPIPVRVVVHLAGKKIELKQLLAIAPGTLLTFNKNCEDLLDLYVNNRLYCRGEAVKIGEKFGLKVNEIASRHG